MYLSKLLKWKMQIPIFVTYCTGMKIELWKWPELTLSLHELNANPYKQLYISSLIPAKTQLS